MRNNDKVRCTRCQRELLVLDNGDTIHKATKLQDCGGRPAPVQDWTARGLGIIK